MVGHGQYWKGFQTWLPILKCENFSIFCLRACQVFDTGRPPRPRRIFHDRYTTTHGLRSTRPKIDLETVKIDFPRISRKLSFLPISELRLLIHLRVFHKVGLFPGSILFLFWSSAQFFLCFIVFKSDEVVKKKMLLILDLKICSYYRRWSKKKHRIIL